MNSEFYLCPEIIKENLEIVNDGEIKLVPILDANNKNNWIILEDSEDERLLNDINNFMQNN